MDLISPWRKSSYSGNDGNCVEVAGDAASVLVRDTKDRDGGTLNVGRREWASFLAVVRSTESDAG